MSFLGLLNDTIMVETFIGQDGYGQPIFNGGQTVRARINFGPKRILNSRGEEITSGVTIYVDSTSISIKDRITLPARYTPQQPPILKIDTPQGLRSIHHTVIYV